MPRHGRGWGMGDGPRRESRHSSLTISLLEPVLLIMLAEQPGHGYTLMSELNTMNMASIHPSVVYRTLREMEGLGWIQSDWDTSQTQGPPRRIYHLTEPGKEALQYWRQELEKTNVIIRQLLEKIS